MSTKEAYIQYQKELLRWEKQLKSAENLLKTHVLVSDKSNLVQNVFFLLNCETRWKSAGKFAKYLMSLHNALFGCESASSKSGFIGSALDRFEREMHLLAFNSSETSRGIEELFFDLSRVISIGMIYTLTQITGNIKEKFPSEDLAAAKKGEALLKELAQIYLLGTNSLGAIFKAIAIHFGLSEKTQKKVAHLGVFRTLIILSLLNEVQEHRNEELLEILMPFFSESIEGMKEAILDTIDRRTMEEKVALSVDNQIKIMEQSLQLRDSSALIKGISNLLEAWGISPEDLKNDIKKVSETCHTISFHVKNAIKAIRTPRPHVDQAA